MVYINQLLNYGIKDGASSLESLRQKYVNTLLFLLMMISIILTGYYFWVGHTTKSILAFSGIVTCFLAGYSNRNFKLETTSLLLCFMVTIIVGSSTFFKIFDPSESVPQAGYLITSFLFIIGCNKSRILYIVFVSLLMTVLVFSFDIELTKTIPVLIQIIVFIIVINFLVLFIESQDRKITQTMLELTSNNIEIKKLNKSLQTQNEEITTFSHAMSHDLKEPIRNISSYVSLIKRRGQTENSKTNEFLDFINKSTESMKTLVDDLLVYSKVNHEQVVLESINLSDQIQEILPNFQYQIESKNVKIEVDNLPVIQGNKQLLKILFHNLISNAIKFQPKKETHIPTIKIKSDSKKNHIIFSDNGIGIDKDYIKNLFIPFKRFHRKSEYDGSGLGMSICLKIMEKHGGKLSLVETSKNGTSFMLNFKTS